MVQGNVEIKVDNDNQRKDLLSNLETIFKDAKANEIYYLGQNNEINFLDQIMIILKGINNAPFTNEDLQYFAYRFNSEEVKPKLKSMFSVDQNLTKLIKDIVDSKQYPDELKNIVREIGIGLMNLQYNLLLSICNPYSKEVPMYKLITAIKEKINILNEINMNKPESEKFKMAYEDLGLIPKYESENVVAQQQQVQQQQQQQVQQQPQQQVQPVQGQLPQEGGDRYFQKYLKYKKKYVSRKNMLRG